MIKLFRRWNTCPMTTHIALRILVLGSLICFYKLIEISTTQKAWQKPWYKLFNKWVQGYAFLSCSSIFLTFPFKTNYGVCNNFWLGVIGISPNASVNTFEIQRSALVIFGLARFQQPSFKTPRSSVYVYYVRLAKRINDSLDCQHRSEVFTEIDVGFVWLEISPSLLILLGRNVT